MPLNNYANLKATVRDRSHISGIGSSDIDDYITQCENEMYYNAQSPLRTRELEARATATLSIVDRFLELPARFIKMRRLKVNEPSTGDVDHDVIFMAPEQMPLANQTQMPQYFSVTTQLEFDSISDSAYTVEMQYVRRATALDSSNTTNDILTNYPNIYLFGCLWALFQDKFEFDQAEYFYQKFIQAIDGANNASQEGRYGPAPQVRQEGYLP